MEDAVEPVRKIAFVCVGRAVGFGALAIAMTMLSLAFHPVLAFRCGAICTLLMAGLLTQKAMLAHRQPPRRTEVWLFLDERSRPSDERADRAFADILREVYGQFARLAFNVACFFFAMSVTLSIAGVRPFMALQS
ncbi:hypothetical protein EJC49_07420 [Aquibium carbonis]|uniref:Uncharacterized protein n=1 Tax=Aquibium carbonis TaxID=2495581 RepID=A0A429Z058_9HYPH|nr:hypothetical protein [Aquibium carbonis]RST87089.1 hypothetical protein EJC49_07420 [Aquibium carbonis]